MKIWTYTIIALTGLSFTAGIQLKFRADVAADLARYRAESSENSSQIGHTVEATFAQMYQGLRTIARLPAVRSIDRYKKNFSAEGAQTVQEIYNNLASNVAMSEVYIVPVDLDPDKIDRQTGKLQVPIVTYDELIIGRHAEQSDRDEKEKDSEVPEIEIYEYRLMKQQLAWFKQHYPRESSITGVKFPALTGPEVITCDNTRYKPSTANDQDRSGLVYSVPFYSPEGTLKGCVSGVILTAALGDLLPSGSYALRHQSHGYTAPPHFHGTWESSARWLKLAQPDPSLLASGTLALPIQDNGSPWLLWNGLPNDEFWKRPTVRAARQFALASHLAVALLTLSLGAVASLVMRNREFMRLTQVRLEERVQGRTADLARANASLQAENLERKRAEAEVQRSRQELQSFIDAMTTLAAKVAPDGTFLIANKIAVDASELAHEECMKTNFLEVPWWTFDPAVQARVRRMFGQALSGTPINYDESISAFGQIKTINFSLIPICDAGGEVEYLVAEGRDITELKQVEKALQGAKTEAERANRAKSEFLSRMSHELRTPLNAILGFGQILDFQDLTPQARESVRYILKGGRHLLDLINEVLDIARVEAGHLEVSLEPVPLSDMIAEACALVRPLAAARDIHLDICFDENTFEPGRCTILADAQRFKQVFINLLSNAIKYNRAGGEVVISCEQEWDGWISILVCDTGLGISPDDLPKLFTPFERLSASASAIEGTGLGLALSQRLVTAMGGTLTAQSTLGQGTTFTLKLLQATASEEQVINVSSTTRFLPADKPSEQLYSVLCIEDNPSNLRLMETIFKLRPEVTLLAAIQGSIGLDLAYHHKPDLILLDLDLPDIHGSEVLTRLQQSAFTRNIPVVVISADATSNQIDQLLLAGAKHYLTKPLDVSEFLLTIDKFLQPVLISALTTSVAGFG